MDDESVNRITVKFLSPNPMFEEWLTIWRDEAAGRDSKMQYCFNTALQSIKKYPLPLESGRDCKILKGFGDKLCQMLDDKLQNYNSQPMNNSNFGRRQFLNENCTQKNISEGKKLTPVTYIPQYKSGAYAILITLYQKSQENKYKGYLTKNEIIKHGKALCNTSFTKTQPGSFYTAWSSMQQLFAKELVYKHSNPAKFSLTNSGIALARVLYEKSSQQDHVQTKTKYAGIIDTFTESGNHASAVGNKCHSALNTEQSFASLSENLSQKRNIRHEANQKLAKFASENLNLVSKKSVMELKSSENSSPQTSSTSIFECFIMPPNSFDIILYVDNCETSRF
ncbi:crossover junction endonuclease MUS81 isoform X2 [Cylas formicarius]|uniref:crossover junction endonuclease MUS81 isoform X2 n=1 Tax=Cylas formicarius TaxID=197179 RepID=UPI0029589EE9|nr:crossover junction endonuclease MUS81 isoform X2 [Cylas formicarius]